MWQLTVDNAASYLRDRDWIAPHERVEISALTGGVSNEVLYVAFPHHEQPDFVLKQSRPQLRVTQQWLCGVERIWREVAVLRACETLLTRHTPAAAQRLRLATPRVLHEDRERFVIAISAAPRNHRVWKADLLVGQLDPRIAEACGQLLATLHAHSWHDAELARELNDTEIFDQLRLDPYFRATARACPEAAPYFERLIDTTRRERHALVHADFSPKNLLVWDAGLLMVDFETGHYGDPAFDLGFFLTHLVAKSIHCSDRRLLDLAERFWQSYRPAMVARIGRAEHERLVERGLQCFAGCLWARVDGKSPLEYLIDERHRAAVRDLARGLFAVPARNWEEVVTRL